MDSNDTVRGRRDKVRTLIDARAYDLELLFKTVEHNNKVTNGAGYEVTVADPRWLAIAKTDLQKGFLALRRAIENEEGF